MFFEKIYRKYGRYLQLYCSRSYVTDNAIGQYNRIADEILTLNELPDRCKIMDSVPEKKKGGYIPKSTCISTYKVL